MNDTKFSIITVCYNSEKTLSRTIESVLNQTYTPYEYIIIDGLSNDKTLEVANRYKNDFKARGVKYSVISEKDNGMYDALNKGCRISHGDLIGQINSDDWYEPNALFEMNNLFKETKFDMSYADLRMINSDGSSWIKHAKISKFVSSRNWNHPTQFTNRKLFFLHPYQCKCMSDDLDFMLWVRSNNYNIVVLNKVIANFCVNGMSHSKDFEDVLKRIRTKSKIYHQNGYSFFHTIDVAFVEIAKCLLDK